MTPRMRRSRPGAGRSCKPIQTEGEEEYKMVYVISDECTACGSCMESCPSEAIKEGDPKYTIDPDLCIDCASCVDVCPVEAISEV